MDDKLQNIFGYIEGYYGKLLTWEYRFKIIKNSKKIILILISTVLKKI